MALVLRTSSTTAGGTANATSLGGRPSASSPSTSLHGFFDTITKAQNDNGHTDYRALFVYNTGPNVIEDVKVTAQNKTGGSTVNLATGTALAADFATYSSAVLSAETTAPANASAWATSVTVGDLQPGQVRHVWIRRVQPKHTPAQSNDNVILTAGGSEIIPE